MQVRSVLHAARWKRRTQKSPKIRHLGTVTQLLSGYVFATKAHTDNRKNPIKQIKSNQIKFILKHKI